jgi:hypothetical protein
MNNVECKLVIAQKHKIRNPRCIYFPVFTRKERCWHYINNQGTQSDAPQCPRLLHRQRTMLRRRIA